MPNDKGRVPLPDIADGHAMNTVSHALKNKDAYVGKPVKRSSGWSGRWAMCANQSPFEQKHISLSKK